ncbi:hypothetical protein [Lutibacter maritimus]|nr:hypothetical protein [Lutibacter maritimus]
MSKKYRAMCGFLDQNGYVFHINRIHSKRFELHKNGTIVKVYKQRHSCNKIIAKKYNSLRA